MWHLPVKLEGKKIIHQFLIGLGPSFYPGNLSLEAKDLEENPPGSHLKINTYHEGSKFNSSLRTHLKKKERE